MHTLQTPWDHLHGLYFSGYALWTYLNLPFVATRPDPASSSRNFPAGQKGRARSGAGCGSLSHPKSAHYLSGYRQFDGIMFPIHRKVLPRGSDNRPDPDRVLIGIEFAGNYTPELTKSAQALHFTAYGRNPPHPRLHQAGV